MSRRFDADPVPDDNLGTGKRPRVEDPEPIVIDDEAEEHGLYAVVQDTLDSIDANGGFWTSEVFRASEDPPSAAIHFTLEGKRYLATFQPVDLSDRAGR